MKIDWAALGSVFGVSLVVTVALVGLFTLGIVGPVPPRTGRGPGRLGRTRGHRRVRLLRGLRGGGGLRDLPDRRLTARPTRAVRSARTHPREAPGRIAVPHLTPCVGLRTLSRRRSTAS